MIVKIRTPRFASAGFSPRPTELETEPVGASSTFHASLVGDDDDRAMQAVQRGVFTPRPDAAERPGPWTLARAWSWLHTKYTLTATKRLRVTETVSLGEKRFLSIVSVDGREFLIGGGSAGVSLLAQLSPANEFASVGTRWDAQ